MIRYGFCKVTLQLNFAKFNIGLIILNQSTNYFDYRINIKLKDRCSQRTKNMAVYYIAVIPQLSRSVFESHHFWRLVNLPHFSFVENS